MIWRMRCSFGQMDKWNQSRYPDMSLPVAATERIRIQWRDSGAGEVGTRSCKSFGLSRPLQTHFELLIVFCESLFLLATFA